MHVKSEYTTAITNVSSSASLHITGADFNRSRFHLREQPARSVFKTVSSMNADSSGLLTIGEIPKHTLVVGTLAVVKGPGVELQPVPLKMTRGIESTRFSKAGAAWIPIAAMRRVVRVVNCISIASLVERRKDVW